jgi:hypothetical protein
MTTFSQYPYYDDFDSTKNFHKILFKPGVAVQSRELTQVQSILQDQIEKFGDHIFKNHSIVSGGQITHNLNVFYLKLNSVNSNNEDVVAADFYSKIITNTNQNVLAKVLATSELVVGGDGSILEPPTLIVTYLTGDTFLNGDTVFIKGENKSASIVPRYSIYEPYTGTSSVVSIDSGVFYIDGYFVEVLPQTIILEKFSSRPSLRVGLTITSDIIDSNEDPSLLDPALTEYNYQAPGADRLKIELTLSSKSLTISDDTDFIELIRFVDGTITKSVKYTQYNLIDDYFARRTFETNGDFIVDKFKISTQANTSNTFILKVGPGKAYVRGYIAENQSTLPLTVNKAKDSRSELESTIYLNYGNYIYITDVRGPFDFKNYIPVDLHCVQSANTTNASGYLATKIGTAKIRALEYSNYTDSSNTQTYVYKASLLDVSTLSLTVTGNGFSASPNTVRLPSYFPSTNNSLTGVKLQISSGNNSGDLVTIAAYDGASKVATASRTFIRDVESTARLTLIYDIKDLESLYITSNTAYRALVDVSSKVNGVANGDVSISASGDQELIYELGYPYVQPASITNAEYYSWVDKSDVSLNGGVISLPTTMEFIGNDGDLSLSTINDNFIVMVTSPGTSGLSIGTIISFSNPATRNITLSSSGQVATFSCSDLTDVLTKVYAKVYITNADDTSIVKGKNIVYPNTSEVFLAGTYVAPNTYVSTTAGQIYIQNAGFSPNNQSLYISDVRYIVKIIDTLSPSTVPTKAMLSMPSHDVSRYYTLYTNAKDNYYDHSYIKKVSNAPSLKGNMLILVNYYDHVSGDGFFTVDSYLSKSSAPDLYENIPSYTATSGRFYNLRDCVDFRPTRVNASNTFSFKTINTPPAGIPVDGSNFKFDYSYYLGRRDLLVLTKDKVFSIIEGISDINPRFPTEPDGAMVIAEISLDPYTATIPGENLLSESTSVTIRYISHKRWRMQDITTLEDRVARVEYYTSLNNLEKSATDLQILDEYGLNRFKNGIATDDFSSFKVSDTSDFNYFASIDPVKKRLYPVHNVKNYPLFLKDALGSFGQLDPSIESVLNYNIDMSGVNSYVTLKYDTVEAAKQPFASRVVNLNPFNFVAKEGVCSLNPPMDNWVSTERLPDLLIVNPDTQLYLQTTDFNKLSTGNWQTISSTNISETSSSGSSGAGKIGAPNAGAASASTKSGGSTGNWDARWTGMGEDVLNDIRSFVSGLSLPQLVSFADLQNFNSILDIVNIPRKTERDAALSTLLRATVQNHDVLLQAIEVGALLFLNRRYPTAAEWNTSGSALIDADVSAGGDKEQSASESLKFVISTFIINARFREYNISQIEGGTSSTTSSTTTEVTTSASTEVSGYWESLGDNFINNNGYVTDVSLNPYIRGQQIEFSASGMLKHCNVNCYFDNTNVSDRIKISNKISIVASANSLFRTGEIFGYNVGDTFKPVAKIIKTYRSNTVIQDTFANTSVDAINLKWGDDACFWTCDVIWDNFSDVYTDPTVRSPSVDYDLATLNFNQDGNISSINSSADIVKVQRFSGIPQYVATNEFSIAQTHPTQLTDITTNPTYNNWWFIKDAFSLRVSKTGAYYNTTTSRIHIFCNTNVITTNTIVGSVYTARPEYVDVVDSTGNLKTDETGSISGIFYLPPNKFHTGEKIFRIDNRVAENVGSETTYSQATFFATSLNQQKQHLNFAPDIGSARNVFTRTEVKTETQITTSTQTTSSGGSSAITVKRDPVCQSIIFYSDEYPNGIFIKSIRVCFRNKPTTYEEPVILSLLEVINGYPSGEVVPHSTVIKNTGEIKISEVPNIDDQNTYTKFEFEIPIYLRPDTLYAFMLKCNSDEYFVYTAKLGDYAAQSSTPTTATPIKISATPYIGELFLSQNAVTWGADQNQDMMFAIERCDFDISTVAQVQYVVPNGLPQRRFGEESFVYRESYANAISNSTSTTYLTNDDRPVHQFNVTTTDLTFENAPIRYSYRSTLADRTKDVYENYISPGKFGCASIENILLNDGKGERTLFSDSNTLGANSSFSLYARLSSTDSRVSPVLSDTGLTLYTVEYKINNMEISNNNIIILNGGVGYSNTPVVTITSSGEGAGSGAVLVANVANGVFQNIYVASGGSGYANDFSITITDSVVPTTNAVIQLVKETSPQGGTATQKYIQKPVTLSSGFDAGDLRVMLTAYRPPSTNIYVYYRILNRNDEYGISNYNWQLMTPISGKTLYSGKENQLYEYTFAPGENEIAVNAVSYTGLSGTIYTNFYKFAIKVVTTTSDKTFIPYISNIITIALPEPI